VDDITINAIDSTTNQSNATQGSLSAQLATFVQDSRAVSSTNGTFTLGGADAAQFRVDATSGQITWASSPTLLNTDKTLELTFTSDVGDVFTETIVIDHSTSNPSIGEVTLNVASAAVPGSVNYDMNTTGNFSTAFDTAFTSGATVVTLTGAPTGVTVNSPASDNLAFDLSHGTLAAGTTVSFEMTLTNGGVVAHTEQVSFTVAGSQPADSVSRATDVSPGKLTVP
jgi:hypothetical protein